jgi:hypothetical protein
MASSGYTETFRNVKLPQASDHLRRFHCDLAMHDPKLTRLRFDFVGADRVGCDSDFPKGVAIKKPAEYGESIPNMTDKERQLVFCENPARVRHLSLSCL